MPERILDRVPTEFQLNPNSQRLRQELLAVDPLLTSDKGLFEEVHGLILYNNYAALKYASPRHSQIRVMNRCLAEANMATVKCVDGRGGGKQQDESPTHTEPGGLTKRATRHYRRARNESGGKHIPRSPFLRGGIQTAALDARDLIEFPEGHFMEEPPRDEYGKHVTPYQACGQASAMQAKGEIEDPDLIRGHLSKINEITIPAITDWYNDCRGAQGRDILKRVCLPLMADTVTRGYVLDLDQKDKKSPLSVAELVKVHKGRIESSLGRLVGGYGAKADWLLDPERIIDLAEARYEITRGLMQDSGLYSFRDEVLSYFSDHYSDLTNQQRTGALFKFANNAALLYLQGAAYGETEHPYKWHNERCIVISPEGNPPFVYFPDVQSFVATPPEPERTITYANTMIDIWNHYHEQASNKNGNTRMPDKVLMFLTTPVFGSLDRANDGFVAASNASGDLFHHMINSSRMGKDYMDGKLEVFSLLYNYQTRVIEAVVKNCAIARRMV